ncbi:1-aminocyclopropane-1-carboxylate deaminase [Candidatus Albibeggiatoa sp. nov. NOAA]|uniref:1-aminocyclopropane-1-carboxylate deaminase n=1 Tax=Candidatus Albibeggiatoa sp. nov. NOAA TaxID=3162724 RepID=UPI0032FAFB45|nr:1-aminocyclopropane-1-carboxylate deaminase [Thiotrichaceae bacterium]
MLAFSQSPIQQVDFNQQRYWIKRDDLLHPLFSGNKARKLCYYLTQSLPHIKTLISYGGSQSNSMLSLAALAQLKQWQFIYYTKPLPKTLKQQPIGNLKQALECGMQLIETQVFPESNQDEHSLFISQGAAETWAEMGVRQLALELNQFVAQQPSQRFALFLPSGTGTTALFLQKHTDLPVITTPCVGDTDYLYKQWAQLDSTCKTYPKIIETKKKYHFGRLYPEFYQLWEQLTQQTQIEFDLLYDPIGWMAVQQFKQKWDGEIIYIHCGGLLGNESMLKRYQYKGIPSSIT